MSEDAERPWEKQKRSDDERSRAKRRRDDEAEDDFDDYGRDPDRRRFAREELRGIASDQKAIITCLLAYGCVVAAAAVVPEEFRVFVLLPLGAVFLAAMLFTFRLATRVYSRTTAVVLCVLTLVLCVNLIVLLVINGKATSVLKAHGISVGFYGANPSDI